MPINFKKTGLLLTLLILLLVQVVAQEGSAVTNQVQKEVQLEHLTAKEVMEKLDVESWDPALSLRYYPGGSQLWLEGPLGLVDAAVSQVRALDRPRREVEYSFRLSRVQARPQAGTESDVKREVQPPQAVPETEDLDTRTVTLEEGEKDQFVLNEDIAVTFQSGQVDADEGAVSNCMLTIDEHKPKSPKAKPLTLRTRLPQGMRTVFVLPQSLNARSTMLLEMKATIRPLNPQAGTPKGETVP